MASCLAGACGPPELVEVAATITTAHLAVVNRTGLVTSSTEEAFITFAAGLVIRLVGRANTVTRAWVAFVDTWALELALGSLALISTLAGRTIDWVEKTGSDLGATARLVVVHRALCFARHANPATSCFTAALGSWLGSRVVEGAGTVTTADTERRILSKTLHVAVPSHPTVDTLAVFEVCRSRACAHERPGGLGESGFLSEVILSSLAAP